MSEVSNISVSLLTTEKSNSLQESQRTYVFRFPRHATKTEIKNYLKKRYSVEVEGIRVAILPGKNYRAGKVYETAAEWKKVYAKLKLGYKIETE